MDRKTITLSRHIEYLTSTIFYALGGGYKVHLLLPLTLSSSDLIMKALLSTPTLIVKFTLCYIISKLFLNPQIISSIWVSTAMKFFKMKWIALIFTWFPYAVTIFFPWFKSLTQERSSVRDKCKMYSYWNLSRDQILTVESVEQLINKSG